jgi:hypothetical protein
VAIDPWLSIIIKIRSHILDLSAMFAYGMGKETMGYRFGTKKATGKNLPVKSAALRANIINSLTSTT